MYEVRESALTIQGEPITCSSPFPEIFLEAATRERRFVKITKPIPSERFRRFLTGESRPTRNESENAFTWTRPTAKRIYPRFFLETHVTMTVI